MYFFLIIVLRKIEKGKEDLIVNKLRKSIRTPGIIFMVVISLLIPLYFVDSFQEITEAMKKILTLVLILVIAWLSIRVVKIFKFVVLKRYDISVEDNLQARKIYTQFRILERIVIFIIIIIAVSLILISFEGIRRIGVSLIASAGVAGIIIGLAAQKAIATTLAGFQIALTQPIRLDDVVIVEGEWGRIEEITLTFVVVKIWDLRRLVVPTTYFIEKPFENWTRQSADILGTVFIYTDYTVPLDAIREETTRLLKDNEFWDGKVNVVQVTDTTEKTMEVRLLISAKDSSAAWNLRVFLREKMIEFLQQKYPDSLPKSRVELKK